MIAYDNQGAAIPYDEIRRAYNALQHDKLARLGFGLLFATGARITELDAFKGSLVKDGTLYWKPGKGQRGTRKARLDPRFTTDLETFQRRAGRRTPSLLGFQAESVVRAFHRARHLLGPAWLVKRPVLRKGRFGEAHTLTLAGLRKSYITLRFAQARQELGDTGLAVQAVQKELCHSSPNMTAYHYVRDVKKLQADRWAFRDPWEILYGEEDQLTLGRFLAEGGIEPPVSSL